MTFWRDFACLVGPIVGKIQGQFMESAGPADAAGAFRVMVTSPEGNCRGGGTILEWAPATKKTDKATFF
jgi:hypothetical protein